MAMELDDKYKKTVHEIEALKDQLGNKVLVKYKNGFIRTSIIYFLCLLFFSSSVYNINNHKPQCSWFEV